MNKGRFALASGALVALLFNIPACGDDDAAVGPSDSGDAGLPLDAAFDATADQCGAACEEDAEASVPPAVCGDGFFSGDEQCDDGNTTANDGCDAKCVLEPGWVCPAAGKPCRPAKCGDGVRVGNELCDDGNPDAKDGCDSRCRPEPDFACTGPGTCPPTTCNDGKREGREACDDKNNNMGDGCSPLCTIEPSCPYNGGQGGACSSTCGDGVHFAGDPEECDDGNTNDGDGCSSTCKKEAGYTCTFVADTALAKLELPLVLRDFKRGWELGPGVQARRPAGHIDFENNALNRGLNLGIVLGTLGSDGKPQYANAGGSTATTTGKAAFDQWYRDVPALNETIVQKMTLNRLANGAYEFNDSTFFPLDGLGSGNEELAHNYHFTSEVRYWFEYKGGEILNFTGDDDVWVFINKRLVIDLGGVHGTAAGSVTLANGNGAVVQAGVTGTKNVPLGLQIGKVYELVVWQAERHTTGSTYRLTLTGFTRTKSTCTTTCGDGIVTPSEVCDDGPGGNKGAYNGCNADCQAYAPYCGDGIVQAEFGEECDDGKNNTPHGAGKCAPGCKNAK